MGKNTVKLSILDTDYIISSDDEEIYIKEIAREVESKIKSIFEANPNLSAMSASILTSMDYCDLFKKSSMSADNLRSQLKDYLEESSRARSELDEARRELARLRKEVNTLRMRLSKSEGTETQTISRESAAKEASPISRGPQASSGEVSRITKVVDDDKPTKISNVEESFNLFDNEE